MADKTFDAVIVGGGNKGLLLALYLIKYAGMSVGVIQMTSDGRGKGKSSFSYIEFPPQSRGKGPGLRERSEDGSQNRVGGGIGNRSGELRTRPEGWKRGSLCGWSVSP
jgi:hypothetical protein